MFMAQTAPAPGATRHGRESALFGDYLLNPDPPGWVTVAGRNDGPEDIKFVFSALATPGSEDDLLKTLEHEVNPTWFGIPTFEGSDDNVSFEPKNRYEKGSVRLEPFVIKRRFQGVRPETYEVVQDFVLYHDLFFDHEKDAYVDLTGDKIVRFERPHMQVREDALRDYLAARKMVLVLYYDRRRQLDAGAAEAFEKNALVAAGSKNGIHYSVTISSDTHGPISWFCGKKTVRPYPEPLHRDYDLVADKPEKYATYECEQDGQCVEKSCDVESGRQPGPFTTSVFFKKEVLSKYHNSHLYKVMDNTVWYLDSWSLEFGHNGELVHAWLGDLGGIPYEEQLHWRVHNVMPRGGMSGKFVRGELLGEFTENKSCCDFLLAIRPKVNAIFKRRFGFYLFKDLPGGGTIGLHDLASDEEGEFDEQILNMAKIFVDGINVRDLKRNKKHLKGMSIQILRLFLAEAGMDPARLEKIAGAFCAVQSLRNGAAHPKREGRPRFPRLEKLGPRERFEKIVVGFGGQLVELGAWLERCQSRPSRDPTSRIKT